LFETIAVEGVREEGGVTLIFRGTPRIFIGTVTVLGPKAQRSIRNWSAPAN